MNETGFYIEDKELGGIKLCHNRKAKRFVFRCSEKGLVCTIPTGASELELLHVIEELRPRLKAMLQRAEERCANQQRFKPEQIENFRRQAKLTLPPRLQALAAARGLHYQRVSIHKSRTRWGSCSSKGNISLSLYLMILPSYLQDYVMQHELTHLIEMNHGPRFWELLNEVTDGKALQYRKEMKEYNGSICL